MEQVKLFKCSTCQETFTRKDSLKRHQLNCGEKRTKHSCVCGKSYTRKFNLKTHQGSCQQYMAVNQQQQPLEIEAAGPAQLLEFNVVEPPQPLVPEPLVPELLESENIEDVAAAAPNVNNTGDVGKPDYSAFFDDSFEDYLVDYSSQPEQNEPDVIAVEEMERPVERDVAADDRGDDADDWSCEYCNKIIDSKDKLKHLQSEYHKENALKKESDDTYMVDSCFGDKVVIYRIVNLEKEDLTVKIFLSNKKATIMKLIKKYTDLHKAINYQIEITTTFVKPDLEGGTIEAKFYINHKYAALNCSTANRNDLFDKAIEEIFEQLCRNTEEIVTKGSNWTLKQIHHLDLHINKKASLIGGAFIDLPASIKAKKACINPKNRDQQCFKRCILAFFLREMLKAAIERKVSQLQGNRSAINNEYSKLWQRLVNMSQNDQRLVESSFSLSFDQINYPTRLEDLHTFVDLNPDINLKVFGISAEDEKTIVGPLFATHRYAQYDINLLYLSNDHGQNHFCWIKDLSRLAARQRKAHRNRQYYCQMCLLAFNSESQLKTHVETGCLSKFSFYYFFIF